MLIQETKYTGYEVVSSSFTNHKASSEGGYIHIESELARVSIVNKTEDGKDAVFFTSVEVTMLGLDKEDKDIHVFECKTEIELKFSMPAKIADQIDKIDDFIKENLWFFANFIDLAIKDSLTNVLKKTRFERVPIRASVTTIEEE